MKFIATSLSLCLCLSLSASRATATTADDFSVTPTSLAFGSVPKTQSKSLSFKAESKKVAEYTVTVTAPFTVSPATGRFGVIEAIGTATDTITVTLPANLPPGSKSGTVTVKFKPKFPLGNTTEVTRTVALSATVTDPNAPTGFDLFTTLQNGTDSVNPQGTIRTAVVKITATVQGGATAAFKTRCLVSIDGAPEIVSYDGLMVYAAGAGQVFTLAHPVPVSVHAMTFRIITDPDNTSVEINENNNTKTISKTFN